MMLVLLLGVWHVALAFSPGGEEKGGKSRDKQELVSRGNPTGEAMAAERAANDLIGKGISDQQSAEAIVTPRPTTTPNPDVTMAAVLDKRQAAQTAVVSRKELRQNLKEELRNARKQGRNMDRPAAPFADDMLIISVILAIIFPPLGVAVWESDITSHFWIALLLTILFWIPGLIYAIYIIVS